MSAVDILKRRVYAFIAVACIVAGISTFSYVPVALAVPYTGEVKIHIIEVGDALSVFVDAGTTEVLIDAGNKPAAAKDPVGDYIAPYVDGPLELVIATHSHADHVGGLAKIYGRFDVSRTIYGDKGTSATFNDFWNAMLAEGCPYAVAKGEDISLQEGVSLTILDTKHNYPNTNNNSVVSIVEYGGNRVIITGDSEDNANANVRSDLVAKIANYRAVRGNGSIDFYIAGHHGSETASSNELLAALRSGSTKGGSVVISTAGPTGQYKFPAQSTLSRLSLYGLSTYATYTSGHTVITLAPGGSSKIATQNGGAAKNGSTIPRNEPAVPKPSTSLPKNPKKVSIKSAKAVGSGKGKVSWAKATDASGYQVLLGTNKGCTKDKKTYTVNKSSATSATIPKLKKGKVYYARVRAYKTFSGVKHYGSWSAVKKLGKVS